MGAAAVLETAAETPPIMKLGEEGRAGISGQAYHSLLMPHLLGQETRQVLGACLGRVHVGTTGSHRGLCRGAKR